MTPRAPYELSFVNNGALRRAPSYLQTPGFTPRSCSRQPKAILSQGPRHRYRPTPAASLLDRLLRILLPDAVLEIDGLVGDENAVSFSTPVFVKVPPAVAVLGECGQGPADRGACVRPDRPDPATAVGALRVNGQLQLAFFVSSLCEVYYRRCCRS